MTSYPCPFCRATADLVAGCPNCGRGPEPDAAEVITLDAQIPALVAAVERARSTLGAAEAALYEVRSRRDAAARRVQAALLVARPPAAVVHPSSAPAGPAPLTPPAGGRTGSAGPAEASTHTVQNVLFLLGGLLLGTAAVVFTAVAWASYGVGVRAALLAAFTVLALGGAVLPLRRGLTATAETFAAVGLLLVLLDGYAAWYVDLFGIAGGSGRTYAGVVCAVTAAVALGYGAGTGLRGPRIAALLVAQPVLPLVFHVEADFLAWSTLLLALAAMNLAVAWWRRDRAGAGELALRVLAWAAHGVALSATALWAGVLLLVAEGGADAARAGAVLVAAALLFVVASISARAVVFQATAGAALVLAVAIAGGRFVATVAGSWTPVLVTAVATVVAVAVALAGPALPSAVRRGPAFAALFVVGGPGVGVAVAAQRAAAAPGAGAAPAFGAALRPPPGGPDRWQVPVMVALLTIGLAALLPRTARTHAGLAGTVLVVLAVPAALSLPWWAAPALSLAAVAGLATTAVRTRSAAPAQVRAAAAALLAADAILVGLGRLGSTAVVLAVLMLLGLGTATLAARSPAGEAAPSHRRLIGGLSLLGALLAGPGALAAGLAAVRVEPWWVARATVIAAALLLPVLVLIGRRWPGYGGYAFAAVLAAALPVPVWAMLGATAEPVGGYAAVGLLLISVAVTVLPAALPVASGSLLAAGAAAVLPAGSLAVALAPGLWSVLVAPYGWLDGGWLAGSSTGRPAGVGLAPFPVTLPAAADAAAVGVLAVAVALTVARRLDRRVAAWSAAPLLALAVVLAVAAAGARWPAVAALSLLFGLATILAASLTRTPASLTRTAEREAAASGGGQAGASGVDRVVVAAVAGFGFLLFGPGLAGSLPTAPATLSAIALTVAVAAAVGAAGRELPARLAGWLAAVTAGVAFAAAAGSAADLAVHRAAFGVLAVAVVAVGAGTVLGRRRAVEGVAVQGAGHAVAVVALLLAVNAPRYAAAVCTLWGVVLGLRALWPRGAAPGRRVLVVAAAGAELLGWWLLLEARHVALVEAYTVPAAGVALLAGWLALRTRPGLSSWVTSGPALAAAFLPSLATVLVGEGQPLRRLLLGAAAVAVVVVGAAGRRQAPVVVAGGVLVLVALHELFLVWDLLPRWIPLAVGGLLLVGLAVTLERRRRDLSRVRAAVTRMT